MTFYRADIQQRYPVDESPTGWYYCSQVHYFNAADAGELDTAIEGVKRLANEVINVNILCDRMWVREWPSGTFVFNSHGLWDHPVLSGPYGPLENGVYAGLLHDGKQVSYRRIRSPLRFEDYEGMELTDTALAYYQDTLTGLYDDYPMMTNVHGVGINGVRVNRQIANWQLRHGTRRRWRRRIVP